MNESTAQIMRKYWLPELPVPYVPPADYEADGPDAPRELVLKGYREESIVLAASVSREDAEEYCNREDTHGRGWFVLFRIA